MLHSGMPSGCSHALVSGRCLPSTGSAGQHGVEQCAALFCSWPVDAALGSISGYSGSDLVAAACAVGMIMLEACVVVYLLQGHTASGQKVGQKKKGVLLAYW